MDDLISRQMAIYNLAYIAKNCAKSDKQKTLIGRCIYMIENMKSAQPKAEAVKIFDDPFTGRMFTTCSRCQNKISPKDKYCKHCGAKMITVKSNGDEK